MKRICCTILFLFLLVACSQETPSGSYAMILVENNTEYNGTEANLTDYEADKVIGKVIKKVPLMYFRPIISPTFLKKERSSSW